MPETSMPKPPHGYYWAVSRDRQWDRLYVSLMQYSPSGVSETELCESCNWSNSGDCNAHNAIYLAEVMLGKFWDRQNNGMGRLTGFSWEGDL